MQEPILFNQSIKENILFGKPDATDLEIRRSCEQANALTFIETEAENKDKEETKKLIFLTSSQSTFSAVRKATF